MIVDAVRVIPCGGGGDGGGGGGGSDGTMAEEDDTLRPPFTPPEAAVEGTAASETRLIHQETQSSKIETQRQQQDDCGEKGDTVDFKVRKGRGRRGGCSKDGDREEVEETR